MYVRGDLLDTWSKGREQKGERTGTIRYRNVTSTYCVRCAPKAKSMISFKVFKIGRKRRKRAKEIGA